MHGARRTRDDPGVRACAPGVVLVCVLLAGCGGDDEPGGSPASGAVGAVPAAAVVRAPTSTDHGVPEASATPFGPGATLTGVPASALVRSGDTTYAAGIGWTATYRGSGLLLSRADARLAGAIGTDGQVSDAVGDGRGGLYVAGDFSRVGAVRRQGVVHVLPDGSLDRRFRATGLGFVDALAAGGGRVYAGRESPGRPAHGPSVVALDARTGARDRRFRARISRQVTELALAGGRLYAGRRIDRSGVPPRAGAVAPLPVSALDPRTGRPVTAFHPAAVRAGGDGDQVSALRVVGGRLWVAVSSYDRDGATHLLDPATGRLRATSTVRGAVRELVPDPGHRRVIAVGSLIRRHGRDLAQALDPRSGARRGAFAVPVRSPRRGPQIADDGLVEGGRLTLGGETVSAGPPLSVPSPVGDLGDAGERGFVSRHRLDTGAAVAGDRPAVPTGPVHALARRRSGLFAGGDFDASDVRSTDLVAFDARTGAPSAAPVPAIYAAEDLAVAGGRVWVTDGIALIAFDPATGRVVHRAALPFDRGTEDRGGGERPGRARVRLTAVGDRVFAVGSGAGDRGVVAYDATTGGRVPFEIPLRSPRNSSAVTLAASDDALYVGGSFLRTRADGTPANLAVLRLDPVTGKLDEAFDPHLDGPASELRATADRLYVDGYFGAGGRPRAQRLTAVDPHTGAPVAAFRSVRTLPDDEVRLGGLGEAVTVRRASAQGPSRAYGPGGGRVDLGVPGVGVLTADDGGDLVAGRVTGTSTVGDVEQHGVVRRR